jgi:hypothetical protein
LDEVANNPSIFDDELTARMYEKFRFLGDKKSIEYCADKRDIRLLIKDKTIFLLASQDIQINLNEMEQIEEEIEEVLLD